MSNVLIVPEWHADVKTSSKITLVVVDMQKLFLTDKTSPWMDKKLLSIVPNIEKLIKTIGEQNVIFTRFTPPKNWQDERDSWQTYYKINQKITTSILGTNALDIIDNFLQHIPNASVASRKKSASIFMAGNFHAKIKKQTSQILIFTGVETDYCVLSSVLDAIHLGYYVIIVMDACASSKEHGQKHARVIFERFPEQLWLISTNDLINHLQNQVKN